MLAVCFIVLSLFSCFWGFSTETTKLKGLTAQIKHLHKRTIVLGINTSATAEELRLVSSPEVPWEVFSKKWT